MTEDIANQHPNSNAFPPDLGMCTFTISSFQPYRPEGGIHRVGEKDVLQPVQHVAGDGGKVTFVLWGMSTCLALFSLAAWRRSVSKPISSGPLRMLTSFTYAFAIFPVTNRGSGLAHTV